MIKDRINKNGLAIFLILLSSLMIGCEEMGNEGEEEEPIEEEEGCAFNLITQEAPFLNREEHASVFFDGRIWVIAGQQRFSDGFSDLKNDVWSSENGEDWTLVTDDAAFEPRRNLSLIVFDNRLWVIGGSGYRPGTREPFEGLSDIWNSVDGITWEKVETNVDFITLSLQNTVVHNNRIFILREGSGTIQESNWYSDDGSNWTEIPINNDFPLRQGITTTSFNGRIWMIAGNGLPTGDIGGFDLIWNNVWSSADCISWVEENSNPAFSNRTEHAVSVFDNRLWISGGRGDDGQGLKSDIWSSSDGVDWTLECLEAFSSRHRHTMVGTNNNLYVIDGASLPILSDVFSLQ
ncbi:MAG: hypothetical protein AAF849_00645 [Bacteroidota bacterium]